MPTPNTPEPSRVRGSGCPLCSKPSSSVAAPFCSPGCRDRDLLAWLGDGYCVPGPPLDDDTLIGGGDGDGMDIGAMDRGAPPPL